MSKNVDASTSVEGYKPPPEFEENERELLTDISFSDSTELWLIQWPANQPPDFDGQELSLQLHRDGQLGSFQSSSGKLYDVVSCTAQADASVFLSSSADTKLVGKISRRISLVHYPEPEELEKAIPSGMKSVYQKSSGISLPSSSRQTTTFRSPHSSSKRTSSTATRSSKPRSSLSEFEEPSKLSSGKNKPESTESKDHVKKDASKRKRTHEPSRSTDHSAQNSGHGNSAITFSGSSGQSSEGKSKKQKK